MNEEMSVKIIELVKNNPEIFYNQQHFFRIAASRLMNDFENEMKRYIEPKELESEKQ
jgi:hypothetical protein